MNGKFISKNRKYIKNYLIARSFESYPQSLNACTHTDTHIYNTLSRMFLVSTYGDALEIDTVSSFFL
jgi:hypothetical protein